MRIVTWLAMGFIALAGLMWTSTAHAGEDDVLLEFHFSPVPGTQIAIWLEDADGNHVDSVFVTQATGSLGIGNRPGRWDFLSSWRFPYGPRPQVLPVWAHRRGKTYPQLVFHDDDPPDLESLGWHESTSSPEPYYCRPLAAEEHTNISMDTMTCPSPAVFQTDKGKFSPTVQSYYPPRGDLTEYEAVHDHDDVQTFSGLNDLDSITRATPSGLMPELTTVVLSADATAGPLTAYIEVNLEHDENADWDFNRESDHFVDTRLSSYGIEYRGQPSVVYRVELPDPQAPGFVGTDAYAGYGNEQGTSGELFPPDNSIATADGSGADRLKLYTLNDETFRFGVYSHGLGADPVDPGSPGWGGCAILDLPTTGSIELEPIEFDTVRVHFTVPEVASNITVRNVRMFIRSGSMPLTEDNAASAQQAVPDAADCSGDLVPGTKVWCDVRELFGNHAYQIGMRVEDTCSNQSPLVADAVTTPQQEFAQVEGFCFVATAAYGAPWAPHVRLLRFFRDDTLRALSVGSAFVQFYYYASPPAANLIARFPLGRAMAQTVLGPLVLAVRGLVLAQHGPQ